MTKARSNATANAAKGDLTVGNGTNLSGVLAVGSNGDTIVADSSTATGLRYTAGTVQDNPILNSSYQVWQRGTSFTPQADIFVYNADRWMTYRGVANYTVTRQVTGDTTNLPNIQYAARIQRTAGTTNTNEILFSQSIETVNSIPYAGKTVTLSFYARKGSDYSQASSAVIGQLVSGTGTDQNVTGGFTNGNAFISQAATVTTTWQRFSYTGTAAANITQLGIMFRFIPVGTAGTNDYFEVTGVQIDIGSVALPFRTNSGTIQGETSACQRYYFRTVAGAAYGRLSSFGNASGATQFTSWVQPPTTMRTTPTAIEYGGNLGAGDNVGVTAITTLALSGQSNNNYIGIDANVASGLTTYRTYNIIANNSSTAYIAATAEL